MAMALTHRREATAPIGIPTVVIVDMGLDLPRYGLIGVDIRAVLDLLHSQFDGEVAKGPIRLPQDRKWQKDSATREPIAGVDDQPSNGPADILKQQVANCPEQAIARLDGIAIDCRCIPQHCSLLYADRSPDRMELFDLVYAAMARRSIRAATGGAIPLAGHGPATGQMRTGSAPRVNPRLCVPRQQRIAFPRSAPLILASGYNSGSLGNYADPIVVNSAWATYNLTAAALSAQAEANTRTTEPHREP